MGAVGNLVHLLRDRGVTVHEYVGWQGRGNENTPELDVKGAILHHTGSNYGSAYAELVRSSQAWAKGGVLANFSGNADGSLTVLASGLAWHAGGGTGPSEGPLRPYRNNRNYHTIGLEIVYPGDKPMTSAQYNTALVFSKAVADLFAGGDIEVVRAHGEVNGAGSQGKWDPGYGRDAKGAGLMIDMKEFRRLANTANYDLLGELTNMNAQELEVYAQRMHRADVDAQRDFYNERPEGVKRTPHDHDVEQTARLILLTEQNEKLLKAIGELVTVMKAK